MTSLGDEMSETAREGAEALTARIEQVFLENYTISHAKFGGLGGDVARVVITREAWADLGHSEVLEVSVSVPVEEDNRHTTKGTDVRRYRKKPVEVEAVRFEVHADGRNNGDYVARWCGGRYHSEAKPSDPTDVAHWIVIPTLEGNMRANPGDWVIRGTQGEFYPCKPRPFEDTFEPIEDVS